MTASKFRKKPVEIEAQQVGTWTDALDVADWLRRHNAEVMVDSTALQDTSKPPLRIKTLEGVMECSWRDWVIRGVQGEFYPCKPDIFAATYDEVTR